MFLKSSFDKYPILTVFSTFSLKVLFQFSRLLFFSVEKLSVKIIADTFEFNLYFFYHYFKYSLVVFIV